MPVIPGRNVSLDVLTQVLAEDIRAFNDNIGKYNFDTESQALPPDATLEVLDEVESQCPTRKGVVPLFFVCLFCLCLFIY